jgi:hypothetical protein
MRAARGYLEELPLADVSVDVVISNCRALEQAGFEEIEILPTHDVHERASSAIIRARKPPRPPRRP